MVYNSSISFWAEREKIIKIITLINWLEEKLSLIDIIYKFEKLSIWFFCKYNYRNIHETFTDQNRIY